MAERIIERAIAEDLPCVIDADGLAIVTRRPHLVRGILNPNPDPNPNPNQAAAALHGVAYCSRELLEADGAGRSGVACGRGSAAKISLHTCIDLFSQQAPCYLLLATC